MVVPSLAALFSYSSGYVLGYKRPFLRAILLDQLEHHSVLLFSPGLFPGLAGVRVCSIFVRFLAGVFVHFGLIIRKPFLGLWMWQLAGRLDLRRKFVREIFFRIGRGLLADLLV